MKPALTSAWRGGSRDGLAGWRIQFAFDQDVIDELKRVVPAECREWNENERFWWVALSHEHALLRLFPSFEGYLAQGSLF